MATEEQKAGSARRRAENRARGLVRPYLRVRARPIIAGARVKVTRRCLERRLFLATGSDPDKVRNDYGYILGRSIEIYGFELHCAIQMGNHHQLDATDVRGVLPDFKCSFHANVAKHFNADRARFSKFWEGGPSCDTRQESDEATLNGIVYDETNPSRPAWSSGRICGRASRPPGGGSARGGPLRAQWGTSIRATRTTRPKW